MRLPKKIKNSIIEAIRASFGNVEIYLFGSRADDTKERG
jgi:predicted nucleotidyltransferase